MQSTETTGRSIHLRGEGPVAGRRGASRPCGPLKGSLLGPVKGGRGGRRGQVLLVAVMLMLGILLLGGLFVAIVNYNQYQTSRQGNMLQAQALAMAGIKYANEMLTRSPLGADWRPPLPPGHNTTANTYDPGFWGPDGVQGTEDDYYLPEEMARGYFTQYAVQSGTDVLERLGYTRYPSPGSTSSDIPLIGQGHVLLRVTYDPDPPFEPSDGGSYTPDNLSKYIKIESVGVAAGRVSSMRKLVAYKPVGLTDYLMWVTDRDGSHKKAYLGVYPWMDLDNSGTVDIHAGPDINHRGEFLVSDYDGPVRIDAELELVGGNLSGDPFAGTLLDPAQASNQFNLTLAPTAPGGYLRDDTVQVKDGIQDVVPGTTGPTATWAQSAAVSWPGQPPQIIRQSTDPAYSTYGEHVMDGVQGQDVNGDSRLVKSLAAPNVFETDPTTGVDRYRALTRDTGPLVDVGGGSLVHEGLLGQGPGIYVDNFNDIQFRKADGTHDLDSLMADWLQQIPQGDPRTADSGWNALHTLYVPKGVQIDLYPTEAATLAAANVPAGNIVTDPNAPPTTPDSIWWPNHQSGEPGIRLVRHDVHWRCANGTDSGLNVMYRDYPLWPNAVIFAEGNIRISGRLPQRGVNPATNRDYDLTVVSGGTIYIDGQILSPLDAQPSMSEEDDTKIALLARDDVCLNTTMLVPQQTSGTVPAAPDDPANPDPDWMHWDLAAGGGLIGTNFFFGAAPAAGESVHLNIVQTAADPGPSGLAMSVRSGGVTRPYDFDGNPATPNYYVYGLLPPGVVPQAPGANVVAPMWQLANYPLDWAGGSYLSGTPGDPNTILIGQSDPGLGPAATDYWAKRWKIQEWAAVGGAQRPIATLHAKINAMIYAQNGCWFVLPGDYFDASAGPTDADGDGVPDSVEYRHYNYDITVRGTITEDYTAPASAARDWTEKWAYPEWEDANTVDWSSIHYVYDESLRAGRDQPTTALVGNVRVSSTDPLYNPGGSPPVPWNLPRAPVLPVSPDLVFLGEAF